MHPSVLTPILLVFLLLAATGGARADDAVIALITRAEAGDAAAQYELAARYSRGLGVPADPDAAGRWLLRAAEGGHGEAQAALGAGLLERARTEQETDTALGWLARAAEGGHVGARMLLIQSALEAGRGEEALHHFRRAAEGGDPRIQVGLARLHAEGQGGLPADPLEAMHWFRLAAIQGDPAGQRGLGALLANGDIGPVDLETGYFWFTLAASGEPGVRRYLDDLAPRLDAEQREALEAMARRWRPGERVPTPKAVAGLAQSAADSQPWSVGHAIAVRRGSGDDAIVELLLGAEEPPARALWDWVLEGGLPPVARSLTLRLDGTARVLGATLRLDDSEAEVAADAVTSMLTLRHGWLGGGLRLQQPAEPLLALDVRVLLEVRPGGR
jgi:hypothetical protein